MVDTSRDSDTSTQRTLEGYLHGAPTYRNDMSKQVYLSPVLLFSFSLIVLKALTWLPAQ